MSNHNCIKHLRSVVQQQQTKISELEKTVAEHKHQLGEQVSLFTGVLATQYLKKILFAAVCGTGLEIAKSSFLFPNNHLM